MKKLRLYYLIAREWILEKYYGTVYDRFLVVSMALILFFLFLLMTT